MANEGNQMNMHEALVKAKKAICNHAKYICQSLSLENSNIQSNCGDVLCAHRDLCEAKTEINAALSAPPRNCDVGTEDEQVDRFIAYCCCKCDGSKCNHALNMEDEIYKCAIKWAQTPYEAERKGETDGR